MQKTQCTACMKYFAGDRYFERHRVNFTCLTTEQMLARGYVSEIRTLHMLYDGKLAKEQHEVWFIHKSREYTRKRREQLISPDELTAQSSN